MKLVALAIVVSACGSARPATPLNACAPAEPTCKTAVEKANIVAKLRDRDVTLAIGQCDQQGWSQPAKQCIADAHATTDLTACGTKFDLGKQGIFANMATLEGLFKAMTDYKQQMCACKDTKCARQVSDAMTKWGAEQEKMDREPPQMSEDDTKRFGALGEEMGTCMQKAMGAAQ
ncbi:hypothetical protein BH11MYX1_BH11MYX1_26310 [soil metagenome]